MLVIFENGNAEKVAATGYFQTLAGKGAHLTDYSAVAHPSQPNYVALISGSFEGVHGDRPPKPPLTRDHIGRHLKSWAVYAEDLDWNCDTGALKTPARKTFATKHVPFLSFDDIAAAGSPACNEHVKSYEDFRSEVKAGALLDFSLVVPNLYNDGHTRSKDCFNDKLLCADHWLKNEVGPLIEDRSGRFNDVVVFVTFDENDLFLWRRNRVYMVALGAHIRPGPVSTPYNHYDLLRTIEAILKVGPVGPGDARGNVIAEIWAQ